MFYIIEYIGFSFNSDSEISSFLQLLSYPGPLQSIQSSNSNNLKLAVIWVSELFRIVREILTFVFSSVAQQELNRICKETVQIEKTSEKLILNSIVEFLNGQDKCVFDPEISSRYISQDATIFEHDYLFILGILFRFLRTKDNPNLYDKEKKAVFTFCEYFLNFYKSNFFDYVSREAKELEKASTVDCTELKQQLEALNQQYADLEKKILKIREDIMNSEAAIASISENINQVKTEIEGLEVDKKQLDNELSSYNNQWKEIQVEATRKQNLFNHFETLSNKLRELEANIKQVSESSLGIQNQLSYKTKEIETLKTRLNDVYLSYRQLFSTSMELQNPHVEKFFNNKFLISNSDKLSIQTTLYPDIKAFKNFITMDSQRLNSLHNEIDRKIASMEAQFSQKEKQCAELNEQVQSTFSNFNAAKSEINNEVSTLNLSITNINNNINRISESRTKELQRLKEQEEKLKSAIAEKEKNLMAKQQTYKKDINSIFSTIVSVYNKIVERSHWWRYFAKPKVDQRLNSLWSLVVGELLNTRNNICTENEHLNVNHSALSLNALHNVSTQNNKKSVSAQNQTSFNMKSLVKQMFDSGDA